MADIAEQKLDAKPVNRMNPGVVWAAIRHHPVLFLGLLVTSLAAGAAAWVFLPMPKNTAAVVFQISGRAPRVISATADNQIDLNSYKQRQAALIKRRLVLNAIRKQPEVAQAAMLQQVSPEQQLALLERLIQVENSRGNTEFMRVYMEGDQPDDMLAIIKALTAAYLAEVEQQRTETTIAT
jgi:polysaccharide biosynthesis transport protein